MCSIKTSNELFQKVDYDIAVSPLWIFSATWSSEWGPSLLERPLGPLLSHLVLLDGCRIVPRTVCLFCFYIILPFNFMKIIHGWGTLWCGISSCKKFLSDFGYRIYSCLRMTWKRIWRVLFFLWNILREMNYFSMPWTQVKSEM